jgi:hypothetical protein
MMLAFEPAWGMVMEDWHDDYEDEYEDDGRVEAHEPPFQVGDRIRYIGTTSFSYGDNPMVEPEDEGHVIENHAGQDGLPHLGAELARPLDGYSVVVIKGNRMAIHRDSTDRYVVIR